MKKRNFLLYAHGSSANHGCEAIVRTTVKLLSLKKEDVTLVSFQPKQDDAYNINELCKVMRIKEKSKPKKGIPFVKAYLKMKILKDYVPMDNLAEATAAGVKAGDIALSVGGDNYCYPGWEGLLRENRKWRQNGLKTVLWGCSVEPDIIKEPDVANDLAKFDLITARESISYEALKSINNSTVFVPDSAFFLDKRETDDTKKMETGKYVGINLSPLVLERESKEGITFKNYCGLIDAILEKTNLNVLLIPHVVVEGNDDREILKKLYDLYCDTNRIQLVEDASCEVIKAYISKCRFFVGARTHATIAAYSLGIPTIVLGYSVKAIGIARDLFGTEEGYVVPVQSLVEEGELAGAFEFLLENEKAIKDCLENIMEGYKNRIEIALQEIEKLKM